MLNRNNAVKACAFVTAYILIAGLWPFTPSVTNEVSWIETRYGIRLGEHGLILSAAGLVSRASGNGSYCSLELLLTPQRTRDSSTILAFSTPENPLQFRLTQSLSDLF